jgi:hypothetical protein
MSSSENDNGIRRARLGDRVSRKFWKLEGGDLCAAARRKTGLRDFGEPSLEPALSILTDSLEREADLHPLGRFLMRVHLMDLLATRLRLVEHWRGWGAELASTPLDRPIFITGMPRKVDLRPAYLWQRRFLQHLQSGQPSRRWVLKSPDHVYGLEALFSVFPDALVVQTHRHPLEVLKSSCHLTGILHGLYAHPRPGGPLAARETKVLAAAVERFILFRDAHPELAGRFVDVSYDEITSHPLACVRRIYERFDIPLRDAAGERMQRLSRARSRYRNGRAPVAPMDLKLATVADVTCFERYCARFQIAWQPTRTQ